MILNCLFDVYCIPSDACQVILRPNSPSSTVFCETLVKIVALDKSSGVVVSEIETVVGFSFGARISGVTVVDVHHVTVIVLSTHHCLGQINITINMIIIYNGYED